MHPLKVNSLSEDGNKIKQIDTTILIPIRNELTRLEDKINQVIEEIIDFETVDLLIVDSSSDDGSEEKCMEILRDSSLPRSRWEIIQLEKLGKSRAINYALDRISSDLVIMMDVDTRASGWLKGFWRIAEDEEIAVISGIESNLNRNSTRNSYKKSSDLIRIVESDLGSTPVIEGGLMGWRLDYLSGFKLQERTNADDAQIAIEGIRRGYRSVVSGSLEFEDTKHQKFDFKRSLRRSQGLSRTILSNSDLILRPIKIRPKLAMLNALFTYILVPWCVIVFCLISPIAIQGETAVGPISGLEVNLSFFLLLLLTPMGRALCWGSIVSITSHCLFVLGKNYSIWNPGEDIVEVVQ